MSILDARSALATRVTARAELAGNDGRSGARLERVLLDDGTRLVVKTTTPTADLVMLLSDDLDGRELQLWRSGALDHLPSELAHAVLGSWQEDGRIITVMRDLGDAVLTWHHRLGASDCRRILGAVTALHRRFAGQAPAWLCPMETYLTALAPASAASLTGGSSPMPALIVRGWERAADLLPADVMAEVHAVFADPAPLARALRAEGTTWLHGDLWPVNIALEPDRVTFLDWGMGVDGPPALDLAGFMIGGSSTTDISKEQLLDLFRQVGGAGESAVLDRSLFAVFAMYAWNKALDAADHPDPDIRRRERADLDWWVSRARLGIEGW